RCRRPCRNRRHAPAPRRDSGPDAGPASPVGVAPCPGSVRPRRHDATAPGPHRLPARRPPRRRALPPRRQENAAMPPAPARRPWWLAAIVIGLGVVCIWGAASLPAASRYAGIGPGSVPRLLGAGLIGLGILLAIQ